MTLSYWSHHIVLRSMTVINSLVYYFLLEYLKRDFYFIYIFFGLYFLWVEIFGTYGSIHTIGGMLTWIDTWITSGKFFFTFHNDVPPTFIPVRSILISTSTTILCKWYSYNDHFPEGGKGGNVAARDAAYLTNLIYLTRQAN